MPLNSCHRSYLISLPILVSLLLFSSSLSAETEIKSPQHIDGVTKVGAEGMIELIDRLDKLAIVDSRIPGDRHKGYIESSISLPDTKTSCKTLARIIPSKSTPSLFYCNGIKCGRSAIAIKIAKKCGYQELYWYRGGFEDWIEKGFPYIQNQD